MKFIVSLSICSSNFHDIDWWLPAISEERGTIWTQLILMTQSPVIGLSATIGDAEGFNKWLEDVQTTHGTSNARLSGGMHSQTRFLGHKHSLIMHPHRYSHLRKFVWGETDDSSTPMRFIHPLAPLELKYVALPADLALESRDCVALFQALIKGAPPTTKSRLSQLQPKEFFKSRSKALLIQKDVLEYEAALKGELNALVRSSDENERQLARDVIDVLSVGFVNEESNPQSEYFLDKEAIGSELVSLLQLLDKQQDLVSTPASSDM